ncbi:MAG TPA: hypothetical protein VG267_13765 [Terracidiphilus sp.]|jgi:hypothetical protein|nr:hypothetical protein [Terracidiphilus sp.]
MSRTRVSVLLACLSMAIPAMAAPADSDAQAAVVAAASGTLSVRLHWDGALPLPAGALIACRARVVPLMPPGASANLQPAEASVQVPGSAGQCALEIPLAWRGWTGPAAVTVVYEMDAASAEGKIARTGSQIVLVSAATGGGLRLTRRM